AGGGAPRTPSGGTEGIMIVPASRTQAGSRKKGGGTDETPSAKAGPNAREGGHEMSDRGQPPVPGRRAPGGIQSVATALNLLDCLAAERELGVAELGRRLGIAKSTAHRIVTTLAAKGIVQQVPETRNYRLGLRLHELGELVASRN